MEVRVLGPVQLVEGDRSIPLGRKERQVVARLAAGRGREVSDDRLINSLWGEHPPSTARKTLHGYAHRIRRAAGAATIVRRGDGYLLGETVLVDFAMAEADLDQARQATADGELDVAAAKYADARDRIRGEPLAELSDDLSVLGIRRQLTELALTIEEEALAADLRRGHQRDVIGALEAIVGRDPTRERAWCLLVTALCAAGRQVDALHALSRAKRALALELGIEPGPQLRELERAVLSQRAETSLPPSRPGAANPAEPALIGRRAEQDVVAASLGALRRVPPKGSALVIRGDPGIGKSALLEWVRILSSDVTVVNTVGVESDAELSFAGLRDLLRPLADHTAALQSPLRTPIEAALLLGPAQPADRLAVSVGALELCKAAAARRPLVMLVDDYQWLDLASADVLRFLASRIRDAAIVLIAAARTPESIPELPGAALLDLKGLTDSDAHELLRRQGDINDAVADRLVTATQGNPMALLHVVRGLSPRQRDGIDALPDPLPLGERLEGAIGRRLAQLPERTRRALLLVASSLVDELRYVETTLTAAGRKPSDLDPAERAGIITRTGDTARFSHPLLRSAVLHAAAPAERRAALRAVARQEPNAERRAWGLALGADRRDEQVATLLEQAGDSARTRLALSAAMSAYERAAALGDPHAEPGRLVQAADAAVEAGLHHKAIELIESVRQNPAETPATWQADLIKARVDMAAGNPANAVKALLKHAQRLEPVAPVQASFLYANAALVSFMPGHVAEALGHAERAVVLAFRTKDETARAIATVTHAAATALAGNRVRTRQTPLSMYHIAASVRADGRMMSSPAQFLAYAGRFEDAARLLSSDLATSRESGAFHTLPHRLSSLADVAFFVGDWESGRAMIEESVGIAEATAQANILGMALALLARYEAYQGAGQCARRHVQQALKSADASGADSVRAYAAHALGAVALAENDVTAAVSHLRAAREICHRLGCHNPLVVPFAPDLIDSLVLIGDRRGAEEIISDLETTARDAQDDWIAGIAARGRGLLATVADAPDHLHDSLTHLERHPLRFEVGRTLLRLGQTERRRQRRANAQQTLHRAAALFDDLGAKPWSQQAARELEAEGRRPREGRERTPRPQQPDVHHDRLPARPPRHAG